MSDGAWVIIAIVALILFLALRGSSGGGDSKKLKRDDGAMGVTKDGAAFYGPVTVTGRGLPGRQSMNFEVYDIAQVKRRIEVFKEMGYPDIFAYAYREDDKTFRLVHYNNGHTQSASHQFE